MCPYNPTTAQAFSSPPRWSDGFLPRSDMMSRASRQMLCLSDKHHWQQLSGRRKHGLVWPGGQQRSKYLLFETASLLFISHMTCKYRERPLTCIYDKRPSTLSSTASISWESIE